MKKSLPKFARFVLKFLTDKPKSKWSALAHIWDRGIVVLAGTWVAVTAFVTNQAGTLLLIVTILAFMFLGLWLVAHSKGR